MIAPVQGWGRNPLTLREIADPGSLADTGRVYGNDVGGRTELVYQDDTGVETQITSLGALNGAAVGLGAAAASRVVLTGAAGLLTTSSDLAYTSTVLTTALLTRGPDGLAGAPTYSFSTSGREDDGMFSHADGQLGFSATGISRLMVLNNGITVASDGFISWSAGALPSGPDTYLYRSGTGNAIEQRNGVNAQTFLVDNTWTNATNYERLSIGWSGNVCTIQTENAGAGSARNLTITAAGTLTLTTPTIASFVNATHDHSNAAGGGNLPAASITTGQLALARGGTNTDLSGGAAVGDILYADAVGTLARLADVATGSALISGGVGVAPSWGQIGLTTHVTGTLAVGNGGTGVTSSTGTGNTVLSAAPTFTGTLTAATIESTSTFATTSMGIGVTTVTASTAFEISSTTRAALLSRMTTTQRDALTAINGMVIYNSTTTTLEGYTNGSWSDLAGGGGTPTFDDIYNNSGLNPTITSDNGELIFSDGGSLPSRSASTQLVLSNTSASTDNVELSLIGGTSSTAITINFGDSVDEDQGRIVYSNLGNSFDMYVGAVSTSVMTLTTTGVIFNDTSADKDFRVEGDGMAYMFFCEGNASSENIAMLTTVAPNWQSMDRGVFIGDVTTAPNANPSAGAFMWVAAGVPRLRQSGGLTGPIVIGGTASYTRNATVVEDRTLLASASATTINNNNVLAALIADLQSLGVIG